jgi:hypothetical protein
MIRKISLSVVLVVGAVWFLATFVLSLWTKTHDADQLTSALKPAFSDATIAQTQADSVAVNAVVKDLNTTTVPLLADLTKQKPNQVVKIVSEAFPSVGRLLTTTDNQGRPYADGRTYLDHAAGYIGTVSTALDANQHDFTLASNIPTKSLPTTGLATLFAILGLVVLGFGGLFLWKPDLARGLGVGLVALGLVVVAVTFVLNVPGKTQSLDNVTNAFRPVVATSGPLSIDEGQQYLDAVAAADTELESKLVPTLAGLLDVPQGTVRSVLTEKDPVLAGALFGKAEGNPAVSPLRDILDRWNGLAAAVKSQRANFAGTDDIPGWGMPSTMVQFLLVGPALIIVLAAIGWIVPPLPAPQPVPVYRRERALVG